MNTAPGNDPRGAAPTRRALCALCALAWASLPVTAAQAQQPAAPAQATSATSATSEFGRLFFTPERRQQLDRQREFKTEEIAPPPASDPTLNIDGVVTRSSGKRTVWINGAALNDGEPTGSVAVGTNRRTPGQVVVRPADTPAIPAKVGDTVDRNSGQTTDLLGGGRITTHTGRPR